MEDSHDSTKKFLIFAMVGVAILSALPMILGVLMAPAGNQFLGYPYATDDHMVYAAWMRQAQDGMFLFDNRFTTDAQPGQTIHIYFFILGLISKVTGIAWATTIAKAIFSALFVFLTHKLLKRMSLEDFALKLTLGFVVFGAGLGFFVWHMFGEAIVTDAPKFFSNFLTGRLPIDVWQPEAFVFPSMLTNSLFMVSLCLMMGVILAVLDSETSWKPVLWGALCMLVLTNIHTYDSLLLGLVAIAFLVMMAVQKKLTGAWTLRGLAIFAGAIPSGFWVWQLLQNDPVFAARASTLTYSPNIRQVLVGLGLLLILGVVQLASPSKGRMSQVGAGVFIAIIAFLTLTSSIHKEGYFMTGAMFALFFILILIVAGLCSEDDTAKSMVIAWALVGFIAIYFPALFQRKLAMGMAIPWAILAAQSLFAMIKNLEGEPRRLVAAFGVIVCSLSSIFWLQRELHFIRENVSRTTMQAMNMPADLVQILDALNRAPGRKVVLAMPGIAQKTISDEGEDVPDRFNTPHWMDVNPIVSGLSGAYTYGGHWSETPNYLERRKELSKFFFARTAPEIRRELIEKSGAQYLIGPPRRNFGTAGKSGFLDVSQYGDVVVEGNEYVLVKIDPKKL